MWGGGREWHRSWLKLLTEENRPETWLETDFRAISTDLYCRFLDHAAGISVTPIDDKDHSNLLNDRFYQPERRDVVFVATCMQRRRSDFILQIWWLSARRGQSMARRRLRGGFFVGRVLRILISHGDCIIDWMLNKFGGTTMY